jgi:glutamate dehydrogenase/leucine dehydrogenase
MLYKSIIVMSDQTQAQPQVITLNNENSVQILMQFIEVAQKAGAFLLPESDILKRCKDVLLSGATDQEINVTQAKTLLMQGVSKGQSNGAYSLEDASILHKVCQFVNSNLNSTVQPTQEVDDDLSSLSDPVPLRVPGPKVV